MLYELITGQDFVFLDTAVDVNDGLRAALSAYFHSSVPHLPGAPGTPSTLKKAPGPDVPEHISSSGCSPTTLA